MTVRRSAELAAKRFFLALLLISVALVAVMVAKLGPALLLAAVLAVMLWPLQTRLQKKLGNRRQLAAAPLILGVIVLLVTPVVAFSAFVVTEGTAGVRFVTSTVESEGMTGLIAELPDPLEKWARKGLELLPAKEGATLDETVNDQLDAQGGKAAAAATTVVAATGSIMFQVAMMLIALFFFLSEGAACLAWLDHASPLKTGQTRELLLEFKKVSYSVIVSTLLTSLAQATAALIGYLIARVPHPFFFAAVTLVCAVIPAVGAGAVACVAALLLLVTGHTGWAIFLGVWGVIVVGLTDNLIKPLLMKNDIDMDGAVVFFSLIGGIAAFGTVGLLIGPLGVAFFLALLRMYHRDFSGKGPMPEKPKSSAAAKRASQAHADAVPNRA